jgi:hypothetical protein
MTALLLWWYQAACGCAWADTEPCWVPCPLHQHMLQARWC